MITGAIYQLPLIALLVVAILRNGLRRRMVSAAMLATVAIYAAYILAIDVTGQIAQVRVFDRMPRDFITANGAILAVFTLSFLLGGGLGRAWGTDHPIEPADRNRRARPADCRRGACSDLGRWLVAVCTLSVEQGGLAACFIWAVRVRWPTCCFCLR